MGPILETIPARGMVKQNTVAFPVFIFFYFQVFVMFLSSTGSIDQSMTPSAQEINRDVQGSQEKVLCKLYVVDSMM